MGGLRSLKRSIAKNVAAQNGLKSNRRYVPKLENGKVDDAADGKSGTKIAYEKLFGKEKKEHG